MKLQKLKQKLASGTGTLPYSVRSEQLLEIDSLGKRLKESARGCLRYGMSLQIIVIKQFYQLCSYSWVHSARLIVSIKRSYRGADKSLVRPGRKQPTATEDFDVRISYLLS